MTEAVLILFTLLLASGLSKEDSECIEPDHISCKDSSEDCLHPSWICDGEVDCRVSGSDEMNCESHRCEEGQFQCKMGHCIDGFRQCDHVEDCHDLSDEVDCVWKCNPFEFQCTDTGKCLSSRQRCDGTLNCGGFDDSDETNCNGPGRQCDDRQFYCSQSNTCINAKWRCNGEDDCMNGEDEVDCESSITCTDGVLCDRNTKCIALTQMCDHHKDCNDGSDENPRTCNEVCNTDTQWACGGYSYGYCIDRRLRCDDVYHCSDKSDERNCDYDIQTSCTEGYRCSDGSCIPLIWRCDSSDDCKDGVVGGSDEANCDVCLETEFMCNNKECKDNKLICDGKKDCPSGVDELYCLSEGDTCDSGYKCHKSDKCIPLWRYCDEVNDCGDNNDEAAGCIPWDSCSTANSNCEHACAPRENGTHVCECYHGYVLHTDNTTCIDVDECKNLTDIVCSQHCHNTVSSYYCTCEEGYLLQVDNKSCKAEAPDPYLVFSMLTEMKKSNVNGTASEVLFSTNQSNIIDFNYAKEQWFWVSTIARRSENDQQDDFERIIEKRYLNNTGIEKIYVDTYMEIHDMAVDWISDKLYICARNRTGGVLRVIDIASGNYTDITQRQINNPATVVLDPKVGIMFWSDVGSNRAGAIERAGMDGSDRIMLANDVYWVYGITVDYVRRKVIWIDAYNGRIEEMGYDGTYRLVVKSLVPEHSTPWAITMFEDFYYWTDRDTSKEAIIKCNRFNTTDIELVRTGLKVPMTVKIVHPLRQLPSPNYCLHHSCTHMCLLRPGGHSCACPEGLMLKDNNTCVLPRDAMDCGVCAGTCTRVTKFQYRCINKTYSTEEAPTAESDNLLRVDGISWWIGLIIGLLAAIILVIGMVGCKQTIRAGIKPCLDRFNIQPVARSTSQDYVHLSLQPSSCATYTTEVSDYDRLKSKKESEI